MTHIVSLIEGLSLIQCKACHLQVVIIDAILKRCFFETRLFKYSYGVYILSLNCNPMAVLLSNSPHHSWPSLSFNEPFPISLQQISMVFTLFSRAYNNTTLREFPAETWRPREKSPNTTPSYHKICKYRIRLIQLYQNRTNFRKFNTEITRNTFCAKIYFFQEAKRIVIFLLKPWI